MAALHICPRCGGKEVRRSRKRGLFERAVSWLIPVQPYRCAGCDHRFTARRTGSFSERPTTLAP